MEVKFNQSQVACLKPIISQVHSQEQTQEVRLTDTYPDIGRILGCWGQPLIRSKEWSGNSMSANGGIMAWVLYAPEDGSQPRVVDTWIPFQCRWGFPEMADNGVITVQPLINNLDARNISARKILLRADVGTMGQAMEAVKESVYTPAQVPEDVQLLIRNYPVELPVESGEKQVEIEEQIPWEKAPIHQIVSYTFSPEIEESKVLGNRLVFRGQGRLHLVYLTEDGGVHHSDFQIPFSQYKELDGDYEPGVKAWILPVMTAMELEKNEDGSLQLHAGVAAQYTLFDMKVLELVEDAYSPQRPINIQSDELRLPIRLDSMELQLNAEGNPNGDMAQVICIDAFEGNPGIHFAENGGQVTMNGSYQVLYRDGEGQLMRDCVRFDSGMPIQSADENHIHFWLKSGSHPEYQPGKDGLKLHNRYQISAQVYSGQPISMVTGLEMGEVTEPNPDRPAVILRRAGEDGIWNLAKACGSTVEAIKSANHLTDEPASGTLLLIPVC